MYTCIRAEAASSTHRRNGLLPPNYVMAKFVRYNNNNHSIYLRVCARPAQLWAAKAQQTYIVPRLYTTKGDDDGHYLPLLFQQQARRRTTCSPTATRKRKRIAALCLWLECCGSFSHEWMNEQTSNSGLASISCDCLPAWATPTKSIQRCWLEFSVSLVMYARFYYHYFLWERWGSKRARFGEVEGRERERRRCQWRTWTKCNADS